MAISAVGLLPLPAAAGGIQRAALCSGADLNCSQADTAGLSLVFSLLLAAGLLLG